MRMLIAFAALGCLGLWGCGGAPVATPPQAAPDPGPPAEDPVSTEFNVTIITKSGPLYVDKLELEFNRRRGIHGFYGFFDGEYDRLEIVPFSELSRIDIFGLMPPSLFDQAVLGREDMNLRRDQAFETRLTYKDRTTVNFYAILPKLRGERDFRLWELGMTNNAGGIEFIEFDR